MPEWTAERPQTLLIQTDKFLNVCSAEDSRHITVDRCVKIDTGDCRDILNLNAIQAILNRMLVR